MLGNYGKKVFVTPQSSVAARRGSQSRGSRRSEMNQCGMVENVRDQNRRQLSFSVKNDSIDRQSKPSSFTRGDSRLDPYNKLLTGLDLAVGKFVQRLDLFYRESVEFFGDVPKRITWLNDISLSTLTLRCD